MPVTKRKTKQLDQFLRRRRRSADVQLQQTARQADRLFRSCVAGVLGLGLLFLVEHSSFTSYLGLGVIILLVTVLGTAFANRVQPHLFGRRSSFGQFVLLVVGTILIAKLVVVLGWSPYLMPLPMFGMVFGIAYSPVIAVLIGLGLAFYLAMLVGSSVVPLGSLGDRLSSLPGFDPQVAVVLCLGVVSAVLGVGRIRKQSLPVIVGFWVGVVQAAAIVGFQLLLGRIEMPDLSSGVESLGRRAQEFFEDPGWGFAGGLICGCIVTCLLPAIEKFFGVVTERRLLDLADPSNTLLRVLRERAPGTFQHTLGVQQLAREATEAIGGDVLLADVGAYYHDIGKIHRPEYFGENMGEDEDKTIHDRLSPSMSKLVIMAHVKDGVLLAEEEKLPQQVVDMIPMHHGTTVVEFFFRKAQRKGGGNEDHAATKIEYRYPGPKPTFAEAGILMLADAVEATAKTITDPTANRFRVMVRELVDGRRFDGQLDECNLTLADLHKIEKSLVRTLTHMYHSRIKYPDGEGDEASREPSSAERVEDGAPASGTRVR